MPALTCQLFTTPDWPCGLESVVLPWLRDRATASTGEPGTVAAIVPTRGDAYALKAAALTADIDLFGVHFITPTELREFLRPGLGDVLPVAPRPLLRLLLATAAETIMKTTSDSAVRQAATAVAGAPDHLQRAIDVLAGGGWDFGQTGPETLRPVLLEFERLLARCGCQSAPKLDAALRDAAPKARPIFHSLLVTGFDGAHWPWWPLLAAAAHSARELTVLLREPQDASADLDITWIGTWEQEFGASDPIAAELSLALARRDFLAGSDTLEQAQAIVQKALQFLADPACEQLGILLPGPGALARHVAGLLAGAEIPHLDSIAHVVPGPFETSAWPAWLAFQETPRLPTLLRFLESAPTAHELFDGLSTSAVADGLRRVQNDILLDDLDVMLDWLRDHSHASSAKPIAEGLAKLTRLSETNRVPDFIAETETAFAALNWPLHIDEMRRGVGSWAAEIDTPVSRRTWLRWLGDTLVSTRSSRSPFGNHPYARIHLLAYGHAGSRTWTHLIVAGLNEGQWPPPFEEAGWIGEREIDELNRKVRVLNQRAIVQGRQGEGHEVVLPGHALCLGPAQRRALAERDFFAAIETTTHAIAATISLSDESTPERTLNPSDFFNRLYHQGTGKIISHDGLVTLARETSAWLAAGVETDQPTPAPSPSVSQTRIAYDARRREDVPFGEYEFSLREPIRDVRLSATAWERALANPSIVWMNAMLGVGAADEDPDPSIWNLALGQWTHRWLGAMARERGGFCLRDEHATAVGRVTSSATNFRRDFEELLRKRNRDLPDWWASVWDQAARTTRALADLLRDETDHSHIATEWKFDTIGIPLDDARTLHVQGRIDVLLASAPTDSGAFPAKVWIIDYKTGNKQSLAPKSALDSAARRVALTADFCKGDGLQLALYALAAHQRGATTLGVSLLTIDLPLDAPQLTQDDLSPAAQASLLSGLHRMETTGVFGARGALRDKFSFADPHPLATLAIDPDILNEKWERTHPDFVVGLSDSENKEDRNS